ncbi:MAG: hypothetical protein LBH81_02845 [Rickettsiales bacterium]|jgi:Cu/Zn superoxide dismutase|nr:hypothetical protein [Rickettsiales bacterium]
MTNNIKKLSMLAIAAVFAAVALGGCTSDSDRGGDSNMAQAEDSGVQKVRARMFLKRADNKNEIGTIGFSERDSTVRMHVDLRDLRANSDFQVVVYDLSNCDEKTTSCGAKKDGMSKQERAAKRAEWLASCEKVRQDIVTPKLQTNSKGQVRMSFLINGTSADDLNNSKIVLTRETRNGEEVAVGWGKLRDRTNRK